MTTTTTVPDLASFAKLLTDRRGQIAEQITTTDDDHERSLLLLVTGLLHQSAMSIYALREYRRGKESQP